MREFKGVEGWIRKHLTIYKLMRKSAPFFCKFMILEEGFDFLGSIKPKSSDFFALDVGANDGTSIRMIRQFLPNSKIIAFDPVTKPKFEISNVDFHNLALGSKSGSFEIFTPSVKGYRLTQYSSFEQAKLLDQITHDLGISVNEVLIDSKNVKVTDLDSLDLRPFFVKIDVEGFELDVLEGARKTIQRNLPIVLIEIQSERTFHAVQLFLGDLGYYSVFVDPKKNLTSSLILKNKCDSYDPAFNNYVWISIQNSSSWSFRA